MITHEQYRDDLPLLAAGALSAQDADQLKNHLYQCQECSEEFEQLRVAMTQVGIAQSGVEPPKRLRAHLLSQIKPEARAVSAWRSPLFWGWVPAVAALVFAALALSNWQKARELEAENHRLIMLAQDRETLLRRSRVLLDTLTAPDALHVTLTAGGKAAAPDAKTIYSAQQHALVLTANNLAPLPKNKAYQLWLLPQQGKPVPYGTFKPDARGNAVLVMTALAPQSPKAFAVTVEAEGGSQAPSSPIVLSGSL